MNALCATSPPRPPRPPRALAACLGLLTAALLGACTLPDEGTGESEVPDAPPVPVGQSAVRVVASHPADGATGVALDAPVWVRFDQQLRADSARYFNTLIVRSGGVGASVVTHYEVVDRQVIGYLPGGLEPGLRYTLTVNPDTIRSLSGAPLAAPFSVTFETGEAASGEVAEAPTPTWEEDVMPIIEASCSCHGPEPAPATWFDIPPLTYERLVGQPSAQAPSYLLVRPHEPADSYLLFKVVAEHPLRRGGVMPPPWADALEREAHDLRAAPLDDDARRLIERWIRLGAPRDRAGVE